MLLDFFYFFSIRQMVSMGSILRYECQSSAETSLLKYGYLGTNQTFDRLWKQGYHSTNSDLSVNYFSCFNAVYSEDRTDSNIANL